MLKFERPPPMNSLEIARDGQQIGHIPPDELPQHIRAGTVLETDLYWSAGANAWRPVSEFLRSRELMPAPAPAPAIRAAAYEAPQTPSSSTPSGPLPVVVINFDMTFSRMIVFMIKWAIASIPAAIIAFLIACFFALAFSAIFGSMIAAFLSNLPK